MRVPRTQLLVLVLICAFILPHTSAQTGDADDIMWTANWSSDGKIIATGGADGVLRMFDGNHYDLISEDSTGYGIERLRWHPRENILAVTGWDTYLLDVGTGNKIPLKAFRDQAGRSIAWDKDGRRIVIADYEGRISLWLANGNLLSTIQKKTTKSYVAVNWHPNGKEIIAMAGSVRRYKLPSEKLVQQFKTRPEDVLLLSVEWHPSGKFFVIGDYGVPGEYPPVLEWFDKDGNSIRASEAGKAEYRNLSWSPDAELLASAGDALRIWSKDGELLYTGDSDANIWGVDWSPDGDRIVTSSETGEIVIWDKEAKRVHSVRY